MGDKPQVEEDESASLSAAEEAHLAMFDGKVMLAGHGMYFATTLGIYAFYRSVTPPATMSLWLTIAVAALSVSTLFCAAFFIRRPGRRETVRFWRVIDKRMTHVFDVVAVSSIFLLFPYGGEGHRLVALAFCIGYGPMQLITDPENLWANRVSVILILGAFAIQLFRMNHDSALTLSILFALYGSMLLFAAGTFHRAFTLAVSQKHQSEAAEAQVRMALAEVSRSRDSKSRFIAMASHDLAHPLQAASLFAAELNAAHGEGAATKALDALRQALANAQSQVQHMLHFLQLEADSVKPMVSTFELEKVLAATVERAIPEARVRKMKVRRVRTSLSVTTDATLLSRAIENMIANAIVHSSGSKVLIGCRRSGATLRIWVYDNGRGIPLADQDAIFQDFVQGDNPQKGGFGLGLASVRRIAAVLGGSSAIDSRWKNGCAIFLQFEGLRP